MPQSNFYWCVQTYNDHQAPGQAPLMTPEDYNIKNDVPFHNELEK